MYSIKVLTISLSFSLLMSCEQELGNTNSEVGAIGQNAMITSAHPLATKVGLDILRKGGNAYDATVAVQFALAVVFQRAGNIGGGGFLVLREKDGKTAALDFREKAPKQASRDMYLDENGEVIPMKSRFGHQAAGVPGAVAGMWELHQQYGVLDWNVLIQPAVELAYYGFTLTNDAANQLNLKQEDFIKANRETPWTVNAAGWQLGDTVKLPELAATLSFIRDMGRDGFYKGIVADQIVKEMNRGGGLISVEDLEDYQPKWREPVTGSYRGYKIISMSPPSSGGVALIQLLQGAEQYDFGKSGHNTSEGIHLMTELARRVYADRATYLGDPDFYDVPVDMLLSSAYNKERFSTIQLGQKTLSNEIKEGEVDIIESVETTHFSIVDANGNAASLTTTLNAYFGCKVLVRGAGFFLNNEMDDFSAKSGVPNMFGLLGAEANAIVPEKRMLSSMTPTILEKDNELFMVTGTPGGATIITSVFQSILNVVDHGMSMQEAVNAKRVHHQWLPDRILVEEGGLSQKVADQLKALGHEVEYRSSWGKIDAILVRPDGSYEGAADYLRCDDYAEGF